MAELKDFAVLEPELVVMKFGNGKDIQEVDLSVFPAFISLKTGELVEKFEFKLETIPMDASIKFMAETLGKLNPAITEDFLWIKCREIQVANNFTYILQRHLDERALAVKKGRKRKN